MDSDSSKRSAGGHKTSRMGYNISIKSAASESNENVQYCNRIGCSGRIKYVRNTTRRTSEKSYSGTYSHSSVVKKVVGNCSKSNSFMSSSKGSILDSKSQLPEQLEFDPPVCSISSNLEAQEPMPSSSMCPNEYQLDLKNSSGKTVVTAAGSSSMPLIIRPHKISQTKSGLQKQSTSTSSVPGVSKSSSVGPSNNGNGSRHEQRTMNHISLPEVLQTSCLSSTSKFTGKNVMKQRLERESSFSRGGMKKATAFSIDGNASPSTNNTPKSDSRHSSCYVASSDGGSTSVRSGRSVNINKTRLSHRQNMKNGPVSRGRAMGAPDTEMPTCRSRLLHNSSANGYSSGLSSDCLPSTGWDNQSTSMRSDLPPSTGWDNQSTSIRSDCLPPSTGWDNEPTSMRSDCLPPSTGWDNEPTSIRSDCLPSTDWDNQPTSNHLMMNGVSLTRLRIHDALPRYHRDEIAEVLLALERIEQDGQLTPEQIVALETSFLIGGYNNFYDQHRDMRLDIDHMSYEELLALEERMGSVSTAVSEEALSKCLGKSIYQVTLSEGHVTGSDKDVDVVKCSICQEEYAPGDEIGSLVECQHGYHISCINQWLRLKNWCPICKTAAAPSK